MDKTDNLLKYIAKNKEYLVNHQLRQSSGKVYTFSEIESGVISLINTRFKKKDKT